MEFIQHGDMIPLKKPTHFVEIVGNDFDKEQWVNQPAPISSLKDYLEITTKATGLRTIAVFKITPKQTA